MFDWSQEIIMFNPAGSYFKKKKCVVCGKMFSTPLPTSTTCSPECSMINKQRYSKELAEANKRYYSKARKSKK